MPELIYLDMYKVSKNQEPPEIQTFFTKNLKKGNTGLSLDNKLDAYFRLLQS